MRFGGECFKKLVRDYEFDTVLDIGSGSGEHADEFRHLGKDVTTIDPDPKARADVSTPYPLCTLEEVGHGWDAIWCCHTLEHMRSPIVSLADMFRTLGSGGILAVTVPPFRQVVPGHVTMWNAGLLLYNLVLAGFDCAEAAVKTYDYNISVIVRKGEYTQATNTMMLEDLAHFFPVPLTGERPGKGVLPSDITEVNW
jgi:SAM-dependent methyltransferase